MIKPLRFAYDFKDGFAAMLFGELLPENSFVAPSQNVVFNKQGILESFNGFSNKSEFGTDAVGGSRIFALDDGYALLVWTKYECAGWSCI